MKDSNTYPLKVGVCAVNTPSNICVLLFLIWHVRLFDFSVYPQPQTPLFLNPEIKTKNKAMVRLHLGSGKF